MYKQALTLAVKHGLAPIALNVFTDLAALMIQEGESQKALELLTQVIEHPASFYETKDQAQKLLADLHKDFAAYAFQIKKDREPLKWQAIAAGFLAS